MLVGETASTMPTDCSHEGRDFAAHRTDTAPGASALSTMIASNLVSVSIRTASGASLQRDTSISSVFRTSPAKSMISWSRENNSDCNAILAELYNCRQERSYRSEGGLP